MAVALEQWASGAAAANANQTLTFPSTPASGNLLVLALFARNTYADQVSYSSGWTSRAVGLNTATADYTEILTAVADGTSAYASFSITHTIGDFLNWAFYEFSGVIDGTVTIESANSANHVTSASGDTGALTIANNSLVLAAVGFRSTTPTSGSFGNLANNYFITQSNYDQLAAWGETATDITPAWTIDTSDTTIGAAGIAVRIAASVPQNLIATAVDHDTISLTWDAYAGATGYDVERDGTVIATDVASNSYTDEPLSPSTLYEYRVRAVL
jgi:hypothetical protein